MQNWKNIYEEQAQAILDNMPEVKWVDLWHNQINFLEEEHPFPAPAVFLQYRARQGNDLGENIQELHLQVEIYLFYETFADTAMRSFNKQSAIGFLDLMTQLYALFHGKDGANYNNMRRTGLQPVDTGNAGNLYVQYFECTVVDEAARKTFTEVEDVPLNVESGQKPASNEDGFFIPG